MNRRDQIQFYKQQLQTAKNLEMVARQSLNTATRLGSEAQSALDRLGAKTERARKGYKLSEEERLEFIAGLYK